MRPNGNFMNIFFSIALLQQFHNNGSLQILTCSLAVSLPNISDEPYHAFENLSAFVFIASNSGDKVKNRFNLREHRILLSALAKTLMATKVKRIKFIIVN